MFDEPRLRMTQQEHIDQTCNVNKPQVRAPVLLSAHAGRVYSSRFSACCVAAVCVAHDSHCRRMVARHHRLRPVAQRVRAAHTTGSVVTRLTLSASVMCAAATGQERGTRANSPAFPRSAPARDSTTSTGALVLRSALLRISRPHPHRVASCVVRACWCAPCCVRAPSPLSPHPGSALTVVVVGCSVRYTDEYKAFLKRFAEMQMDAYEVGKGWFFWNFKTERAPDVRALVSCFLLLLLAELVCAASDSFTALRSQCRCYAQWNYLLGIQQGWMPADLNKRTYSCPPH